MYMLNVSFKFNELALRQSKNIREYSGFEYAIRDVMESHSII